MSEAMAALLPQYWKQGMSKVVADVEPGKDRSVRLLKKFDFLETGRECKTGEVDSDWYDNMYFAFKRPKDTPYIYGQPT